MSKIEARTLTESEFNQWDQLVEQSGKGTIFQSSKWITTAAKNLHIEYIIIGVFNNSDLIGGCSFYIKNRFHALKYGYTNIPLTPYGGFIISIPKSSNVREAEGREREIILLILEKIKTLNLFNVTIINNPALTDIRPFIRQGWTERVYYTYIMPLENDIFLHISHDVRKSIRKAQKIGINVKKEYNPQIYWSLTKSTYDKQNMNIPYQKEYLFSLMEMLLKNNLGEMWIAETPSGDPASAAFNLYDSDRVQGWVAANDPRFKDTQAVSLLLFEMMKEYQNRGFCSMNLMAGNLPNLSKFYSSFNPKLLSYYKIEKTASIHLSEHLRELTGL
jgi:lipid II:glycine glycyltransferase (peptidoglycan interpeptide bridge formation enzyme)